MRKLFELVLNKIKSSDRLDIFWTGHIRPSITKDPTTYSWHSCIFKYVFNFTLKFEDGSPDVFVRVKAYEPTKTETVTVTYRTGWFKLKRKTEDKIKTLESTPKYLIESGNLSYITTIEESKQLHQEFENLTNRHNAKIEERENQQLQDRLDNKIKLKTTQQ